LLGLVDLDIGLIMAMGEGTGLAAGSSLYKKQVFKNWSVYVISSETT